MTIITESNYIRTMSDTVTPYLQKRRQAHPFSNGGQRIYCELYRADRPRGTVLLSHGFTESARKYEEVIYYFLQMGYHVCIPEHFGHGNSSRLTNDPSLVHIDHWERYVSDLLKASALAKAMLPEGPLLLFGHSMGGGIAAAAAARCPQRFHAVILSSPMIRPLTGGVPWQIARSIAELACLFGKSSSYAAGQHPYDGRETFEDSAGTSQARFDYYQSIRQREPLYQTSAPSYGWLREAFRLSRRLLSGTDAASRLTMSVLLCQAGQDSFVSEKAQNLFVQKSGGHIRLVRFEHARHEIYCSTDAVLQQYWHEIENFLFEAQV